jgi:hypothetical protein
MGTMRNEERIREAVEMRRLGMTYKAIGGVLGVSADRARQLVVGFEFRQARPRQWFDGLELATARRLLAAGFKSRDDCLRLADDRVARDHTRSKEWFRLTPRMVNDVRAWLGVTPFNSDLSEQEIVERAKRLLERHGYTVTKG